MPSSKTKKKDSTAIFNPPKLSKDVLAKINKMANAYSAYEARLGQRATMNAKEKNDLLIQFMENYKDDIRTYIYGNDLNSNGLDEADMKAMGLNDTARSFVLSYRMFIRKDQGKAFAASHQFDISSNFYSKSKEALEENAQSGGATGAEGEDLAVSEEQSKGLREIAKWMYRNAEDRTAARRGSKHLGNKDHTIFIEEILRKSAKQRLLIFYLIEKGNPKECTTEDLIRSQVYVPNLEAFKKKILKSGIKRLFSKENVNWNLFGTAVQNAGVSINSLDAIAKIEEDDADAKADRENNFRDNLSRLSKDARGKERALEEARKAEPNIEHSADEFADPSLEEQIKMLPELSRRLRKYIEEDEKAQHLKSGATRQINNQEEVDILKALYRIQHNMSAKVKEMSQDDADSRANDEVRDPKANEKIVLFKKLGDGINKLPITPFMAAGAALNGCAILIKLGGLIQNYDILSKADVSERVLSLISSCVDFSSNVARLGLLANAGTNFLAASATAATVSGALGIVSGGLSMTVAAVEAGRADALGKGVKKSDQYLSTIENSDTKDVKMAKNIQSFATSMYHSKALSAGKNMVAGTVTAIGGALTLSGVGMVPGLILTGIGLLINIVGSVAGKKLAAKDRIKLIDSFFGLDEIIEQLNLPNEVKNNKEDMKLLRDELRLFGEAKLGAANDKQAINIILSRYAHFLWVKVFKQGDRYTTEDDFNGEPRGDADKIAYACKTLVSSMGVKIRFGDDNRTTEEEIRRRMIL